MTYSPPKKSSSARQIAAMVGGASLAAYGLSRKSKGGAAMAALGGAVAMGTLRQRSTSARTPIEASFAINCTPETAYSLWRNFENLPKFMPHLESVVVNGRQSDWTAFGPEETRLHWKAELIEDRPNECIAWRSLPGAEVENSGSVEFRKGTAGRGTIVSVRMVYLPPAGVLGEIAANLSGKPPEFTVREDLRRFKAFIEAGEMPTVQGQTHGPRGSKGKVERLLFREPQNETKPQQGEDLRKIA